jgi:hypothetical protein
MEFAQRFTLGTVDKILLDAAHDAEAIYEWLNHQNIEPFIDLNNRKKKKTDTDSDIKLSPSGVPICPIGNEMKSNGYDHTQHRQKWRCPLACGAKNTCPTPFDRQVRADVPYVSRGQPSSVPENQPSIRSLEDDLQTAYFGRTL